MFTKTARRGRDEACAGGVGAPVYGREEKEAGEKGFVWDERRGDSSMQWRGGVRGLRCPEEGNIRRRKRRDVEDVF